MQQPADLPAGAHWNQLPKDAENASYAVYCHYTHRGGRVTQQFIDLTNHKCSIGKKLNTHNIKLRLDLHVNVCIQLRLVD